MTIIIYQSEVVFLYNTIFTNQLANFMQILLISHVEALWYQNKVHWY